jgi:predicted Zn finger-like uncharacterized protein
MGKIQPNISQSYYRRKGKNKGTQMNGANAQTKVIQCPSCQTKFAVKTSMLTSANVPRFHCSRCDHVFSLEQQMEMQLVEAAHDPIMESEPAAEMQTRAADSGFEESEWTAGLTDETSNTADSMTDETLEVPSFDSIMKDEPETTVPPVEPQSASSYDDLAINRMSTAKTTEMPGAVRREALDQMDMVLNPRARRPRFGQSSMDDGDTNTFGAADTAAPEAEQTISETATYEAEPAQPATQPTKPVQQEITTPFAKKPDSWSIEAPVEDTLASDTLTGGGIQKAISNARLGRWKSAAALSIPLVGFLGVLLLAGFVLSQNPETAWAIGNSISGSTTRVAPAGLYMSNVSHEEIELESGELVHVISGKVHNTSDQTFTTLNLEGLTFNAAGRLLTRTLVPANATLGKTRIKSLSLEMIRNLQDNARNARFSMKPDETQDFTIAIIHEEPVNVAYYSARVYSVN